MGHELLAERPYFEAVATELGLLRRADNQWCRHPLSYLMEAADDICCAILGQDEKARDIRGAGEALIARESYLVGNAMLALTAGKQE
ncbi:hypothetical protein QU487_10560 [Crenobacter sp. SG2305]|uniref:hypothetical protein n=1 Tax=Crenobacter oryzisoli TaxID=3056844 RepID=UPI0025AAC8C3|nr:hypothetical protein [Crenobacter sp. SG2305]MDN0083192.1 hypothetical protein [Crenobacter sp. SG2305]